MYYSISCYKLLTKAINCRFSRNYKYVYILRMFIADFLKHLHKYKHTISSYLILNKAFNHWLPNLNSSKANLIGNSSYILFIKFFMLLLQRRNAFAITLRKERTILYHIRQISNYVFYEKHIQMLSLIKQDILSFDLKKRILDSIFNVSRYTRKKRFMNKRHIFNLISFNIVLSSNRFDRLKKGRKSRTFYSNKIKFIQLYKNMFNIRTTRIFKKYIQYILSRLKRLIGISSIYFHQIHTYLLSYFFHYLYLFNKTQEISNLHLLVNNVKYSVSNFYHLLIGDRIEISTAFFNYILTLRKLSIAFVLTQLFYDCSTILPIKLQKNKNKNYPIPGNVPNATCIRKYLYAEKSETFNPTDIYSITTTTSVGQLICHINNILKHHSRQIDYKSYDQKVVSTWKSYKKGKINLLKKPTTNKSRYCLLGYVFDSIHNTLRTKLYILNTILAIYLHYASVSNTALISCQQSFWFKLLLPLSKAHLQFITASNSYNNGIYFQFQLCNLNLRNLLEYTNDSQFANINLRINNTMYTQYFAFSRKLKYYFGFADYVDIHSLLMPSNSKLVSMRRIFTTSAIELARLVTNPLSTNEDKFIDTTIAKQDINSLFSLVKTTRYLTIVQIYRTIYYCLLKLIRLICTSNLFVAPVNTALTHYHDNSLYIQFFPNLIESYSDVVHENLMRGVITLLYIRNNILYNRRATKFHFFRIKKFRRKRKSFDKSKPSLKRGYNFSIIQNNDYFRRLGIYDLRSFVKKVFIDKTMPRYNSMQYNNYFDRQNYKHIRTQGNNYSQGISQKQKSVQNINTNARKINSYENRINEEKEKLHRSKLVRFYYTDSINKLNEQIPQQFNKVGKKNGRIRIKLVNTDISNNTQVINKNKFEKSIHKMSIEKIPYTTDRNIKSDFGNLIIATLHRILTLRYIQLNKSNYYLSKLNVLKRYSTIYQRQLTRSIANDNIIDLYYLAMLNKQFNTTHINDNLEYILNQLDRRIDKYNVLHLRIISNIYLYLKYIKQWFYLYSLNTINFLKNDDVVQQQPVDLVHNLKVMKEYHAIRRKFINITPLLYKSTKDKLKFIIYTFSNILYNSDKSIKTIPTNLRYLFLDKSSKILASKFR